MLGLISLVSLEMAVKAPCVTFNVICLINTGGEEQSEESNCFIILFVSTVCAA